MKYIILILSLFFITIAQVYTISGVVTDKSTGEVLPGVNIIIVGTKLGASTDIQGHYKIKHVPKGTYNITFKYVGYTSKTIKRIQINKNKRVNTTLSSNTENNDIVTVTAQKEFRGKSATSSLQFYSTGKRSNKINMQYMPSRNKPFNITFRT